MHFIKRMLFVFSAILISNCLIAQGGMQWFKDGTSYSRVEEGQIVKYVLPSNTKTVIVSKDKLIPKGQTAALPIRSFVFSEDGQKVLIFANSKKVWRYQTRGDYWLLNLSNNSLYQIGKNRPASSLMFAKFSPDGKLVAYVSDYNLYYELTDEPVVPKQLTFDGNRKFINGTFDWAYEEEFFCRDGFRWSPDSKKIAFWQIDARNTKDYLMVNNTDSIYPFVVPVEYPIAGEKPSPFKIGVINIPTAETKWMNIPTDPVLGSYVPRMEWAANSNEVIIQHLNRRQNTSDVMLCNVVTGESKTIFHETDSAWIDILALWDADYSNGGWEWLNNGKEFIWASEKDGWRHVYRISREGKETLITVGNYDVIDIAAINEKAGFIYFFASPENATQKYLYRIKLDGKGKAEKLSPANQPGTHDYNVSPTGQFAMHSFTNHYLRSVNEWVSLPDHKGLNGENKVNDAIAKADMKSSSVEFLKIKTADGVEMDAWMVKPSNFDQSKKYPVVFFVYTEPWGQEVKDRFGIANNFLYQGDMAKDGYIYMSIDNRGTPVPKGRAWRKSVHRKIGIVNIRDQAMAAKEIM
ncbi:MAG TPA: DPP IV N-terminal domain-containing protein, partial [Chitinophagaceae bacterium]|nr:DPP IV N-terminal domain-containing protein [Chitinophagaceae bacterium]